MSAFGTKGTCRSHSVMSAFGGKADIGLKRFDVRLCSHSSLMCATLPRKEAWDMTFARLQKKCKSGSDDRDSRWMQKQRAKYRKGTLEEDKIKKLESLGISWEPNKQCWHSMYDKLASCIDENEKCHISYDHSDKQLFNWATTQRALKEEDCSVLIGERN